MLSNGYVEFHSVTIYVLVLLVEDIDYPISKTPWLAERDTGEVGKYRFAEERSPSECGIVAIS